MSHTPKSCEALRHCRKMTTCGEFSRNVYLNCMMEITLYIQKDEIFHMMLRNVGHCFNLIYFMRFLQLWSMVLSITVRMIPSEQHVLNSFWHLALMHFTNLFQFIVKIKDIWTATKARFLCKVLATWRDVKV